MDCGPGNEAMTRRMRLALKSTPNSPSPEPQLLLVLDELHNKFKFNVLIATTEPIWHYFYCEWAVTRNIHILCDKPPFIESNAAFDIDSAAKIQKRFDKILSLIEFQKSIGHEFLEIVE